MVNRTSRSDKLVQRCKRLVCGRIKERKTLPEVRAAIKQDKFNESLFDLENFIRKQQEPKQYREAVELEYLIARLYLSSDFPDQTEQGIDTESLQVLALWLAADMTCRLARVLPLHI